MGIEDVFRTEYGRILATLIRLLGDFDIAEEALQEAFAAALEQWPMTGTPGKPAAWLVSTARHKAIDRLRQRAGLAQKQEEIAHHLELSAEEEAPVPEDRLRLLFTCCHPALATEAQVALTLRTLGGLSTEEIARAFLVPAPTMAQRIVRAKAKIRTARIPYQVPLDDALTERLEAVMVVVYLVFNEGYAASFGDRLVRHELCDQAIRLGRMLVEIALREGGRPPGPYALQAAIAAVHVQAPTAAATDWAQIAALYDVLARVHPTPVVELNRAVAVAMSAGFEHGLALVDELDHGGELDGYHLLSVARAELLRRLDRHTEAAESYRRALELVSNEAERRHLERRLREVVSSSWSG